MMSTDLTENVFFILKKTVKNDYKFCESWYNKFKKNRCTSNTENFRDTMAIYFERRNKNAAEKKGILRKRSVKTYVN